MEEKKFAVVCWTINDIRNLKPEWDEAKAHRFLAEYNLHIRDVMVEAGLKAVEELID